MGAKQKEIFEYLRSVDCCRVCCLRFLKPTKESFNDIDAALAKLNLVDPTESEENGEQKSKKVKENVCIACLGLFDSLDSLADEVKQSETFQRYSKCEAGFFASISLPLVLHLRQLSLWYDVVERFPANYDKLTFPDIAVKDALKTVLIHHLERTLGKPFSVDGVMVTVPFTYEHEQKELQALERIRPGIFAERKAQKHTRKEFLTLNAFEKHFTPDMIDVNLFRTHYSVPPVSSENVGLVRGEISVTGPTMFVAGRYNKWSRKLSQTPWVIEGKRLMEGSVQETLEAAIAPHFGVPEGQLIFSSSGREDVDVRCLGEGRPFVLEIPNALTDQLPEQVAVAMEQAVEASGTVSIRDLQLVKRTDLVHIHGNESDKRKFYRALCVTTEPVNGEMIRKLRVDKTIELQQVTPLRVLHRRPLLKRSRHIYRLQAWAVRDNPHAMVIELETEAGTYIKEFVHGDFGRTKPNIREMIGVPIDIHALDVMAIDLDWPQRLRR
ncbi:putative tRNA pseudouridine synthase Pus10 [Anopheles aquasalis]|uniref:putative tRNA pseudouridine synthase Pus10 n=1 Tax=Anopheles aquasalis TaxID=42839 RepID=UPI00215B58F4|nr:putative tRNA pseudouridine synthase Pus10 [Anopheles aquasalis]